MQTRIVSALGRGPGATAAQSLIEQTRAGLSGQEPVLVLVFASTHQPLPELMPVLSRAFTGATLLGASSAGEFTEQGEAKGGVSLLAVAGDFKAFAGFSTGLRDDVEGAVTRALVEMPAEVPGYPHRSAILMLDPLSGKGEEAVLIAGVMLGDGVRLAGGAAGDDLKMVCAQVGLGPKVASDALVLATIFTKAPLGVGVCHAHEPLSAPLTVTRSQGSIVHEVDGRPAWQVWSEVTRASAARRGVDTARLSDADIGGFLLRYEAGLDVGSGELKIRAPLSRGPQGELQFACGIPEGTVFRVTEGEPVHQIESARTAARRALDQIGGLPVAGALVFDCICRNLILGSQFKTAIEVIAQELGDVPLAGFETYGEIALDAGDLSGFHNTTTVVLAFPR